LIETYVLLRKFDEAQHIAISSTNIYTLAGDLIPVAVAIAKEGKLTEAIKLIQSSEDRRTRDNAIRELAWRLRYWAIETSQEEALIEALRIVQDQEERLRFFTGIPNESQFGPAMFIIAEAYAHTDNFPKALELAKLTKKDEQCELYANLFTRIQSRTNVLSLFKSLQVLDDKTRSCVFRALIYKLEMSSHSKIQKSEITQLRKTKTEEPAGVTLINFAKTIATEQERSVALGAIGIYEADRGNLSEASMALLAIEEGKARYFVLRAIGRAQAKAGLKDQSLASFAEALKIAQTFERRERGSSTRADRYLAALAKDQTNAGQIAEALNVVSLMDGNKSEGATLVEGKVNDDLDRRWALYGIVRAQARAGQVIEAQKTLKSLKRPHQHLDIEDGAIPEELAKAGLINEALKNLENVRSEDRVRIVATLLAGKKIADAQQIAASIDDIRYKVEAQAAIAKTLIATDSTQEALGILSQAAASVSAIKYDNIQIDKLLQIAGSLPR
jgi:hypothetical protein